MSAGSVGVRADNLAAVIYVIGPRAICIGKRIVESGVGTTIVQIAMPAAVEIETDDSSAIVDAFSEGAPIGVRIEQGSVGSAAVKKPYVGHTIGKGPNDLAEVIDTLDISPIYVGGSSDRCVAAARV